MESNTDWGSRYARELRKVIVTHAEQAPRSLQVHLGPSELGSQCDRQVVAKLTGAQRTNHVSDPWPSIVGTSVHAWFAQAFEAENDRERMLRWLTEVQVTPHPLYPGHADLYDALEQAVIDHKVLGATSLAKIKRPEGPSLRYRVQLLLYGYGFRALGLPVKRVVLAAYPRTAATLDGMYIWDHPFMPEDELVVAEVLRRTDVRQQIAADVRAGRMSLQQVPASPDDDECFFCPFYRPQSAYDHGPGCPGTVTPASRLTLLSELVPQRPLELVGQPQCGRPLFWGAPGDVAQLVDALPGRHLAQVALNRRQLAGVPLAETDQIVVDLGDLLHAGILQAVVADADALQHLAHFREPHLDLEQVEECARRGCATCRLQLAQPLVIRLAVEVLRPAAGRPHLFPSVGAAADHPVGLAPGELGGSLPDLELLHDLRVGQSLLDDLVDRRGVDLPGTRHGRLLFCSFRRLALALRHRGSHSVPAALVLELSQPSCLTLRLALQRPLRLELPLLPRPLFPLPRRPLPRVDRFRIRHRIARFL
jgi:hypothetical protein